MNRATGQDGAASVALSDAEFAALLAPFAPFEPQPHLAIAVSGGADSLALTLLADRWARERGGRITALTVDHRLQPGSAAAAAQVGAWLRPRGIAHEILVRAGPVPARGIEAAARAARFGLLESWCAAADVLHLLLAHHREDQAETLLLRLARGSGLDGLAGMAAEVEHAQCRVLRPLLALPRARLAATLDACGQPWITDPMNRDPSHARVRVREGAALLAAEGLTAARLAATAARLGRARAALEADVAALLARAAWLHPAGFAWLEPVPIGEAPEEVGLRALACVIGTVSGAAYPPRLAGLERLYRALPGGAAAGRTLGGCRVLPRRGRVLVCREPRAMAPAVPALPGATTCWDGRFTLRLSVTAPGGLRLGPLGAAGGGGPDGEIKPEFPAAVRPTLPALSDRNGVLAAPHLDFLRPDSDFGRDVAFAIDYRPGRPLARTGFTVV
jgi:tRNA(Ile)-lysidine synthase